MSLNKPEDSAQTSQSVQDQDQMECSQCHHQKEAYQPPFHFCPYGHTICSRCADAVMSNSCPICTAPFEKIQNEYHGQNQASYIGGSKVDEENEDSDGLKVGAEAEDKNSKKRKHDDSQDHFIESDTQEMVIKVKTDQTIKIINDADNNAVTLAKNPDADFSITSTSTTEDKISRISFSFGPNGISNINSSVSNLGTIRFGTPVGGNSSTATIQTTEGQNQAGNSGDSIVVDENENSDGLKKGTEDKNAKKMKHDDDSDTEAEDSHDDFIESDEKEIVIKVKTGQTIKIINDDDNSAVTLTKNPDTEFAITSTSTSENKTFHLSFSFGPIGIYDINSSVSHLGTIGNQVGAHVVGNSSQIATIGNGFDGLFGFVPVFGPGTPVTRNVSNSRFTANGETIIGHNNIISGSANIINGHNNNIKGDNNKVNGLNNHIHGNSNEITGSNNLSIGLNNKASGFKNNCYSTINVGNVCRIL